MKASVLHGRFAGGTLFTVAAVMIAALSNTSRAATPPDTCKPEASFRTVVPGVLTVVAVQQLPSIDVNVSDGQARGLDPVVLGGFAKANCLTLKIEPLPGSSAVAAMTEGKADVAAGGWYRTEARGKVLGQTEPTWYDQVGVVAHGKIASINDLKGKKIGIVGGSLFAGPLTDAIGKANVVTYQSIDAIFQDLAARRIDAALGAGATLTIQVKDRKATNLVVSLMDPDPAYPQLTAPGEPNYPYTKSNAALGEALNAWVRKQRTDGVVAKELAKFGITSDFALHGPKK